MALALVLKIVAAVLYLLFAMGIWCLFMVHLLADESNLSRYPATSNHEHVVSIAVAMMKLVAIPCAILELRGREATTAIEHSLEEWYRRAFRITLLFIICSIVFVVLTLLGGVWLLTFAVILTIIAVKQLAQWGALAGSEDGRGAALALIVPAIGMFIVFGCIWMLGYVPVQWIVDLHPFFAANMKRFATMQSTLDHGGRDFFGYPFVSMWRGMLTVDMYLLLLIGIVGAGLLIGLVCIVALRLFLLFSRYLHDRLGLTDKTLIPLGGAVLYIIGDLVESMDKVLTPIFQ